MKITIDDPRLTAYALNELDPADRSEVEKALADTPELKHEVESIRDLGSSLHHCFSMETVPPLDREIAPGSPGNGPKDKIINARPPRWRQLLISGGVAASFLAFCGYMLFTRVDRTNENVVMEPGPTSDRSIKDVLVLSPSSNAVDDSIVYKNDESLDVAEKEAGEVLRSDSFHTAARRTMERDKDRRGGEYDDFTPFAALPEEAEPDERYESTARPESRAELHRARSVGLADSDGVEPSVGGVDRSTRLYADTEGLPTPSGEAVGGRELAMGQSKKRKATPSDYLDLGDSNKDAAKPESRAEILSASVERRGSSVRRVSGAEVAEASDSYGLASMRRKNLDNLGYRTPGYIPPAPVPGQGEDYKALVDNAYLDPVNPDTARSTFSVDVDTASYANVRRFLRDGQLPPSDAVRIEELINYFDYNYQPPAPDASTPFAVKVDAAASPWNQGHRLVRIAVKGKTMTHDERPQANLVFLCDVSGSMSSNDKLPLLKKSLREMVKNLNDNDRVTLVTYARGTECPLEPTLGSDRAQILAAIDNLQSSGGTNGEGGIRLAYDKAKEFFMAKGVNRVLLATDGDFNVGVTNTDTLINMVREKAEKDKIFLTILGFGTGNLKDSRMEQIANKCNGEYYYIDSEMEGRKVLVNEMASTLVPIAKDVKIQVEFNPAKVSRYRLIGYANRRMRNEEFLDDKKDAGEIGAGHSVTAFYEIVPAGVEPVKPLPDLRYRIPVPVPEKPRVSDTFTDNPEMLQVSLRYKLPDEDASQQVDFPFVDKGRTWEEIDVDFRFAGAVAAFGMQLRQSPYAGTGDLQKVLAWAQNAVDEDDEFGLRKEFLELVKTATRLK